MNAVVYRPFSHLAGNLTELVDTLVTPNGLYGEMVFQSSPGEFAPVAESAYCGVGVAHTMLLHSVPSSSSSSSAAATAATSGSILQVFPGVPPTAAWDNITFHNLKATGNVGVSAVRTNGEVRWIALASHSNVSTSVNVSVPRDKKWQQPDTPPQTSPAGVDVRVVPGWTAAGYVAWRVTLAPNQLVVVFVDDGDRVVGAAAPSFTIQAVPANESEYHWFGYSRAMPLLH